MRIKIGKQNNLPMAFFLSVTCKVREHNKRKFHIKEDDGPRIKWIMFMGNEDSKQLILYGFYIIIDKFIIYTHIIKMLMRFICTFIQSV